MRRARRPSRQGGFSYLALLIAVAIVGTLGAGAVTAGAALQRRAAEDELLFVGAQFQQAFKTFYEATPTGARPYPSQLNDLLRDPRYPMPRRHLRKVYADPLTGQAKWGFIEAPGGGIMGVYSLSEETPIRVAGFPGELAHLEGKSRYAEWTFSYVPQVQNASKVLAIYPLPDYLSRSPPLSAFGQ